MSLERLREADVMHIYVRLALFACLWEGLGGGRFYAYLRESGPLCMSLERLREADVMHIYVI